jgi:2-phosphoglycerate kinase
MQPEQYNLTADTQALQEQLQHVYWIGGGSGAGKSTIAARLAAECGFQLYATDDAMADHAKRSTSEDSPLLHEFMAMDMDERWVNRSAKEMLETFPWFQGECFNMIIEDILRLPKEPAVIVEGFRLLPRLVKPLLTTGNHAVWLLPTPEFRQMVTNSRGWPTQGFLGKTSDPEKALHNLLERDAMFTDSLYQEAKSLELNTIEVNATMTVDDLVRRVIEGFEL